MRDRQTCVGCGKQSPETETNYTLISAQFGWRLTRYKNPDGALIVEWRCPTCWREYKRARTIKPGESNPPPSMSPSDLPPPMRPRTPLPKPPGLPPATLGAFRARSPSTPDETGRRSSNPGVAPGDRRSSSSPLRPSPAPLPAQPSRPSPSPPAGTPPTGRPGRGSR